MVLQPCRILFRGDNQLLLSFQTFEAFFYSLQILAAEIMMVVKLALCAVCALLAFPPAVQAKRFLLPVILVRLFPVMRGFGVFLRRAVLMLHTGTRKNKVADTDTALVFS